MTPRIERIWFAIKIILITIGILMAAKFGTPCRMDELNCSPTDPELMQLLDTTEV